MCLSRLLKFSTVATWLIRHQAPVSPCDSGRSSQVFFPGMYIMNGLKFHPFIFPQPFSPGPFRMTKGKKCFSSWEYFLESFPFKMSLHFILLLIDTLIIMHIYHSVIFWYMYTLCHDQTRVISISLASNLYQFFVVRTLKFLLSSFLDFFLNDRQRE